VRHKLGALQDPILNVANTDFKTLLQFAKGGLFVRGVEAEFLELDRLVASKVAYCP
jgi:hypothetical protein